MPPKSWNKSSPNPPLVTYRHPKNLRDLLVHSALTTPTPTPSTNTSNNKCNNKRCKCCQEMVTGNTFKSQITGRKYHIRSNISCKTKKSGLSHIMENTLHIIRMNGHRLDIRARKKEKSVAAHFCQPDHTGEDLQVMGSRRSTGAAHSGEERERASGSSPSRCCLHTGWILTSDFMVYAAIVYTNTAYAMNNWLFASAPWTEVLRNLVCPCCALALAVSWLQPCMKCKFAHHCWELSALSDTYLLMCRV